MTFDLLKTVVSYVRVLWVRMIIITLIMKENPFDSPFFLHFPFFATNHWFKNPFCVSLGIILELSVFCRGCGYGGELNNWVAVSGSGFEDWKKVFWQKECKNSQGKNGLFSFLSSMSWVDYFLFTVKWQILKPTFIVVELVSNHTDP